jgi:hypothetical protein
MEGRVPFAWSAGPEAVVIIGTELPAGLGQDGVRPRKRIRCGGLPAVALSVCLQYVCSLSAVCLQFVCSLSVWQESQGSRQLGVGGDQDWAAGCAWAWALGLLGVGSTAVQYITVQYCTVCVHICMHDANANVGGLGWLHPQVHHEA